MSFRDILAPVLSLKEDEAALTAAEVLARSYKAKIRALLVEVKPPPIYTLEGVLNVAIADALTQEQQDFVAETARLEERAGNSACTMSASTLSIVPDKLGSEVGVSGWRDITRWEKSIWTTRSGGTSLTMRH